MLPVYRWVDSNPYQKNQMPFPQIYYPISEVVPHQMRVDPSKFPVAHESCPYGGNYGYTNPCHGCFPGYCSFRPPYPHLSQPLPFHYHGSYPAFPEAYPFQFVPPPHYSMEQPRYEYDKSVLSNHHCCGWPNHTGHWKEDKNVKIEEHEPDTGKKGNDYLAPGELKNYPYPIVWIPPGYLKSIDHRQAFQSEVKNGDEVRRDTKPAESLNSVEPSMWNGWVPLDMSSLGSLKQDGNGKRTQNQQDGDQMGQFPLPIIWMPSCDKPEEVGRKDYKESNAAPKSVEEPISKFKVIPLEIAERDDSMEKCKGNEENSGDEVGSKMVEKNAYRKSIPVKQMEPHGEMNMTLEDSRGKTWDKAVKLVEDDGTKKPSEGSAKKQSSSPPKMSKLPPVCLRADPMPRRKNGNGCSRSPSPPGHEGNSQEISNEKSKASTSTGLKVNSQQDSQASNCTTSKSKEVGPHKKETKVIEVTEKTDGQKDRDLKNGFQTEIPVNLHIDFSEEFPKNPFMAVEKAGIDAGKCDIEEGKGVRDVEVVASKEGTKAKQEAKQEAEEALLGGGECKIEENNKGVSEAEEKSEDLSKAKKKNLLDVDAAVIIQSAYRGFEVRKWEPLKKLKQIAKVREQVGEVRSCIQALESSSDLGREDKQRVVIGETIMSLLLKLDSIQGLHPSLRDMRKSVARELTSLQEKLDSLTIQKEKELNKDVSKPTLVEGCVESQNDLFVQELRDDEAKAGLVDICFESSHDNSSGLMESHQSQPPNMTDVVSGSQGEETSGPLLLDGVHKECENKTTEIPVACDVEPKAVEPEAITKPNAELVDEKRDGSQGVMMEIKKQNCEPCSDYELGQPVEHTLVAEEKIIYETDSTESHFEVVSSEESKSNVVAEDDDSMSVDKGPEMNQLLEMPEVVVNAETNALESEKIKQIKSLKDEVLQCGEVEQTETAKIEVLHDGEAEYNVGIGVTSPYDEAPILNQLEQQPQEALDEGSLTANLEDSVKVYEHNDEGDHDDLKLHSEEEGMPTQGENGVHDNELVAAEAQPKFSSVEKEGHDEEQAAANTEVASQEEEVPIKEVFTSREEEVPIKETKGNNVYQSGAIGEKEAEVPEGRTKSKTGNDKFLDLPNEPGTDKDEALAATQFSPSAAEPSREEEDELFPYSSTISQVSVVENITENDKKIIEENEKLKEMMEKLIEAGKQQLTIISNLSERVKDLERKLSRKKKLRTQRDRAATPGSSCLKQ